MGKINNALQEFSSLGTRILIRGFTILSIILNFSVVQAWAQTHSQGFPVESIGKSREVETTTAGLASRPSNILLPETETCYPGIGWKWMYGPFQPEIAAEVQQSLMKYGIATLIKARNYGEVDSCGNFKPYSLDFFITVQSKTAVNITRQEEIAELINQVLLQHSTLEIGRVQLTFSPTGDTKVLVSPIIYEAEFYSSQSDVIPDSTLQRRVYVVVYNPLLSNGQTLYEYRDWNEHAAITQGLIDLFNQASNSWAEYTIAETRVITDSTEGWPIKIDGFRYTEEEYLNILDGLSVPHTPDTANYNLILSSQELDICGKLNRDEIDEVWLFGGPYFGFYESRLAGPNAFLFNSLPVPEPTNCNKLLPIMGLNYERELSEALHSFGHRAEATMTNVYGNWQQNRTAHNWDRFGLVEALSSDYDYSGCGSVHFPPNGTQDYDYSNAFATLSNCDDFENYPVLGDPSQTASPVSCTIWDCKSLGFMEYWFGHLPKNNGCGPDSVANSWWIYFADPSFAVDPPAACNLSAGVRIEGKTNSLTNEYNIFTAITSPISVTLPITYTWQATEHDQITYINSSFSNTITLTWPETGTKIITVTVSNANGTLTDTHEINVSSELTEVFSIIQNSDDAGRMPECNYTVNANEIYFGKCTTGESATSGFRFAEITIPRAAEIRNAYIEFTVDGTYENEIEVAIFGENSSNALTFSDINPPSVRPLTGISTTWSIPTSDIWRVGETRQSPNLTEIIQEIVDLPDWVRGNSLAIITRNAGDASLPNDHRRVMAFERLPLGGQSARLMITYAAPIPIDAYFEGNSLTGIAPLTAVFTDTSSGRISSWWWDFGDGNTADIQNPSHTYTEAGVYSVTLSVIGPMGTDTITRDDFVTVTDNLHVPDLTLTKTIDPTMAVAGETITYTLEFSNAGEVTATSVVITDIIPISVTNTSVINTGASITQTTPGYVWNVQDLAPGESGVITITGVVSENLFMDVFTNTASITGIPPDINMANNTSSVPLSVDTQSPAVLSISVGWNLIGMPLQPIQSLTAKRLLDGLNEQNLFCTEVDRWLNGGWDAHIDTLPFNNFVIEEGKGYFVKCSNPGSWIYQGDRLVSGIPIDLQVSWNLIAIPYPTGYTAQALLDDINDQEGMCTEISRWLNGGWDSHINGLPFNDFPLEQDKGYFVFCDITSSFIP